MRTFLVNRQIGIARPIPVTTSRGSQQLSRSVVEGFRKAGLMPEPHEPATPPRKPSHVEVDALARCAAHGIVPAGGCPSGCSRRFLSAVYADDDDVPQVRNCTGQFQVVPKAAESDDGAGELALPEEEVRATLRRILSHCPAGSKKPLARLCGYRGEWALHSLRGVAKGRAMLPEAVRYRLSPILRQIMQGQLVPTRTGQLHTAGRPSMTWARADSAAAQHSRVSFTP